MLQGAGVAALAAAAACSDTSQDAAAPPEAAAVDWPIQLGDDVPKICLGSGDAARLRIWKQAGVNYVLSGGGRAPWTVDDLRKRMAETEAEGVKLINLMLGGMNDIIHGGPNRDKEIEDWIASIRAAGEAGLPVIEYNFYAHRLTEGYKEEAGRAGAGYTAYDYNLSKDLPPEEGVGTHTRAEQLDRARYFLEAVIPEAEKANVRLALHPNDPPVPLSRGSEQIMASFEQWKDYLDLVKSPFNGMTFDCGVTREMGEDPVAVARHLGRDRDCINHVHFRNVVVRQPYIDYTEVFIDEGQVNMFAVMRELVAQKYSRGLYPEHPRAMDIDKGPDGTVRAYYPGGGGPAAEIYNVAFTKAMLLATLSS
jgi:mannonate dehydratase